MAYTTGVAATPQTLLTSIQSALTTSGWTIEHRGVDNGSGDPANEDWRRDVLWASNSGMYLGMCYKGVAAGPEHEFRIFGATSYSGSLATSEQAGYEYVSADYLTIPCTSWHVFCEATHMYLVLEGTGAHYRHVGFGGMTKQDTYAGGSFIYGHYSGNGSNHNRPFAGHISSGQGTATTKIMIGGDGQAVAWRNNGHPHSFPTAIRGAIKTNDGYLTERLAKAATNQFNNQLILVRPYPSVLRSAGYYSPIGVPPEMRFLYGSTLPTGVQDITLGGDTWKSFPVGQRGSTQTEFEAGDLNMAYLV